MHVFSVFWPRGSWHQLLWMMNFSVNQVVSQSNHEPKQNTNRYMSTHHKITWFWCFLFLPIKLRNLCLFFFCFHPSYLFHFTLPLKVPGNDTFPPAWQGLSVPRWRPMKRHSPRRRRWAQRFHPSSSSNGATLPVGPVVGGFCPKGFGGFFGDKRYI